ncbi:MAG: hypothetical protein L6R40_008668 [Gallowayella cf. fulva]|nr:MAG: hypothetical protein L6R40_008668 [Xanthomendoza cf. fulva]
MAANDRQDVISYAEPAIPTANSLSDSGQPNNECVAQDESVILNHHSIFEADFDRVSTASIHSDNARSEHRSDENGQNEEPPVQSLSLIYDNNSAAEKQVAAEAASERISLAMEREDMDEDLVGQDIREQGERGAASADGAWEEQESERGSEEEPQAQSSEKATTSEHVRQRNSVSHAQPSAASASSGKLKRNRVVNSTGGSSNKRQRRSMTADVKEFKRKDISTFFKQTALIPKDFHQPEEIYESFLNDAQPTILQPPNSFDQLSKICTTLRQNQSLPTPRATNSLRQVVRALDSLDVQFSVASVLRRYFLVSLKTHRMRLEEEHQHSPSVRTRMAPKRLATSSENGQSQTVSTFDRADTQALRKMMEEAYPDLQSIRRIRGGVVDEYQKKLAALKERIRSGRNWKILQEKYGPSILLLIPSRDEYNIRDSEVEKLSISVLGTLIEMLSEYRGAFLEAVCGKVSQIVTAIEDRSDIDKRYKFENITGASLKKEPPDSSRFIEYCELDTDDLPRKPAKPNDGPQELTSY